MATAQTPSTSLNQALSSSGSPFEVGGTTVNSNDPFYSYYQGLMQQFPSAVQEINPQNNLPSSYYTNPGGPSVYGLAPYNGPFVPDLLINNAGLSNPNAFLGTNGQVSIPAQILDSELGWEQTGRMDSFTGGPDAAPYSTPESFVQGALQGAQDEAQQVASGKAYNDYVNSHPSNNLSLGDIFLHDLESIAPLAFGGPLAAAASIGGGLATGSLQDQTSNDLQNGVSLSDAAKTIGSEALGSVIGYGFDQAGVSSALGQTASDTAAGAIGGAAKSAIAGSNPLLGGVEGGVVSGLQSGFSGGSTSTLDSVTVEGAPAATDSAPVSAAPTGGNSMSWLDDIGSFFGGGDTATPSPVQSPDAGISFGQPTTNFGSSGGFTAPNGDFSDPLSSLAPAGQSPSVTNFLAGSPDISSGTTGFTNTGSVGPSVANAASLGNGLPSGAKPNSFLNFLSNPTGGQYGVGNALSAIGNNAGTLLSVAGLGKSIADIGTPTPGAANVTNAANQLGTQGAQLQSYLANGTLPPGVQTGIDQATQAAKATIRSQYAARGMSGSSAEATDLAAVDSQAQSQGANIALNLLNSGVSETQLSAQLYQSIMQNALQSDQQFGSSLSNLAGQLSGTGAGGGGITINTGKAA